MPVLCQAHWRRKGRSGLRPERGARLQGAAVVVLEVGRVGRAVAALCLAVRRLQLQCYKPSGAQLKSVVCHLSCHL